MRHNPIYEFTLTQGTAKRKASPAYKDDLARETEAESGQQFYRDRLSGKLTFTGGDFEFITQADPDGEILIDIDISTDGGGSWRRFFEGKFAMTDFSVDLDNRTAEAQPSARDAYEAVLSRMDEEFHLVDLPLDNEPLILTRRPVVQAYKAGDSKVTNYMGANCWEQDVDEAKDNDAMSDPEQPWSFEQGAVFGEVKLEAVDPAYAEYDGVYAGQIRNVTDGSAGKFTKRGSGAWFSYLYQKTLTGTEFVIINLYDGDKIVLAFDFEQFITGLPSVIEFVSSFGRDVYAKATAMFSYVYFRLLLDAPTLNGTPTNELPADDPFGQTNLRRALRYAYGGAVISDYLSDEPTTWGRNELRRFYAPPRAGLLPLAKDGWGYTSLWMEPVPYYAQLDRAGRAEFTLKDAYPLHSLIKQLLAKIAPGVSHEGTAQYSQFLYGDKNPLTGDFFRLYATPKSNILAGDYDTAAQKGDITLGGLTAMLRDTMRLYWWIEDGKFRIEHLSFFENGMAYGGSPAVGFDTTAMTCARNGKAWAFGTNKYDFNKQDIPEYYQFAWADEVTAPFAGGKIEPQSALAKTGRKEDINISGFTSDIDLMLASPAAVARDGWALVAAERPDIAADRLPGARCVETAGTDGECLPRLALNPSAGGHPATMRVIAMGGGEARVLFVGSDGQVTDSGASFAADSHFHDVPLRVPAGAAFLSVRAEGTVRAQVWRLTTDDQMRAVFRSATVGGVAHEMQNGLLAYYYLLPNYYIYGMPCRQLKVNGDYMPARSVARIRKQKVTFPASDAIDPALLVRTGLGAGRIAKISVNLSSLMADAELNHGT